MGIAVGCIAFEGPAPTFETLRDVLAERLKTPIDLIETPPGFWVGMMVSEGRLRGFSIERHADALAPEWPCTTPEDELLLRVLTELGGTLELVHSPAPGRVRNRFHFSGAVPTPEQVERGLTQATGRVPSKQAFECPLGHELHAPMLVGGPDAVVLEVTSFGIRLIGGAGNGPLLWEASEALISLGGRELDLGSMNPFAP